MAQRLLLEFGSEPSSRKARRKERKLAVQLVVLEAEARLELVLAA